MLCILSPDNSPYFNLASEEYLLKNFKEDIILLYRNSPSIVVGKHQNTLAEINFPFVQEKEILVARRISGGGTVYHDLGNLNFAFFTSGKEGELVDYKRATLPIIEALSTLGLDVKLGKRHELLLEGLKISGTASHVFKQRVLHHGTLLFSSEMGVLSEALKTSGERFTDRAVKSVPSRVTNIVKHLDEPMEISGFTERLHGHFLRAMEQANDYQFTSADLKEIKALRDKKFSTWEWNFGYSPKYQYSRRLSAGEGHVNIHMNVEKGIIREIRIEGDFISEKDVTALEQLLIGCIHDPETIRLKLSGIQLSEYMSGLENEDFIAGMF